MENQTNSNQDCGCSEGCCTPKKKGNLWKRLLFVIIILVAGAIISVKLVSSHNKLSEKCCPAESSSCCPQIKQDTVPTKCCATMETPCCSGADKQDSVPAKCCETQETTPCCSQSETAK